MKATVRATVKLIRNDPESDKALREFIATGKLNSTRTFKIRDAANGVEREVKLKLIPAQG